MTPTRFDLTGPLPSGTTVLEASAGTGKTYTIAGLVTRWVAETPLRLPQLLVVTFTRAATAELRDRVRARLVSAVGHLEAALHEDSVHTDDAVLAHLARCGHDELRRRRDAVAAAIREVDIATISTIHGFCQHVLDGLGIASELDRDAELVDHLDELVEEVADDLLVGTYHDAEGRPRVSRRELLEIGRKVVGNPTTPLAPLGEVGPEPGLRRHLAQRFREEVQARARRRRRISYDDLLTQLDATLRDPDRGPTARDLLRDRYRVVLIDEFQDTDPLQWNIVSSAFLEPDPGRALVLIGDPKQAIYSFRGADVYAYLEAAERSDRRTLSTNWRSDAGLLSSFDTLYDGTSFGDEDIPYRRVDHAPGHDQPRLEGPSDPAPLRLRWLPHHPEVLGAKGDIVADQARRLIARDLAADVVRLLEAQPRLTRRGADGAALAERPLEPRDIAVLVRTNEQATVVQDALRTVAVPSVIGGVESVFGTPAAAQWQRLLEALDRPASTGSVRALAMTDWVGWSADRVATASERDWDHLHEDLHLWAETFRRDGLAAMHRRVILERGVRSRLLGLEGGERTLADLEHIAEVLHATATGEQLGLAGLLGWINERLEEAGDDQHDDRLRRLETDDEAVQILTIHRSKGLEFPVVYCPYLWSSNIEPGRVPVFHDDDGQRRIDVGGNGHEGYDDHRGRAMDELRGEQLRLVYVATTRARHQVVAWYASAGNPEWSGLGRLLLCRDGDGRPRTDAAAPADVDDGALEASLRQLAAGADGGITVERVERDPASVPWEGPDRSSVELDRARFSRTLDDAWRRTSYSALTRLDEPESMVGSEPPAVGKDDEAIDADELTVTEPGEDAGRQAELQVPLGEMAGGAQVGTVVHRALETADFRAADLEAELAVRVAGARTGTNLGIDDGAVATGLAASLRTPLGIGNGLSLSQVGREDRRDEVEFELPLSSGDRRAVTVGDVAALLDEHLRADDPLSGYSQTLPDVLLGRDLRGFLGGSIDLVFRRSAEDGEPVFHVVDYKTNRLGPWGEPLTLWDYRQTSLADAMVHGHYPLQALLYSVALHRTLRWRLPGYDAARHLGDVLYLFVRGMIGPDTPAPEGRPHGVFAWSVPPALVEALSDALHGVPA